MKQSKRKGQPIRFMLNGLSLLILAACAWTIGNIHELSNGFYGKFEPCIDAANEFRLSYGLFFVPQVIGMAILGANFRKAMVFAMASTAIFYTFIAVFWTGRGCYLDYELIHWGGWAATLFSCWIACPRVAYIKSNRRNVASASITVFLAAAAAWLLGLHALPPEMTWLNSPITGRWFHGNLSLLGAATIVAAAATPSLAASLSEKRFALLPEAASATAMACLILMALPHALGASALFVEPISFAGAWLPIIAGVALARARGGSVGRVQP